MVKPTLGFILAAMTGFTFGGNMSKDAYYFPHDSNARNDEDILSLRLEFGYEGYGIYWAIIETLRDAKDYKLCSSNAIAMLSLSLNIDKSLLENIYKKCVEVGLLIEKNGHFYSESLKRRMLVLDEKRQKRVEAGRKGGNAKAMLKQSQSNALAVNKSKVNKSKVNKSKEVKDSDTHIQDLMFRTFGRTAKLPEVELITEWLDKWGEKQVYKMLKDASLKGFKNFATLRDALDSSGNIKDRDKKYEYQKTDDGDEFHVIGG